MAMCVSSAVQHSPLYVATQEGHTEVVGTLLRYGADPNLATKVLGLTCCFTSYMCTCCMLVHYLTPVLSTVSTLNNFKLHNCWAISVQKNMLVSCVCSNKKLMNLIPLPLLSIHYPRLPLVLFH